MLSASSSQAFISILKMSWLNSVLTYSVLTSPGWAKLVKDGFGEVHSIHCWGETSDCSEDNRSEVDQELRKRPLARYIFPVKGPPVILMKSMVAWMLSILSKRARCAGVMLPYVVIVCQLSWRVRALCLFAPSSVAGRLTSDMSGVLFER